MRSGRYSTTAGGAATISLPFGLLVTSILGAVFAGFVCSTMGIFVVRMNLASIGFCMSHAAFAGAAFGIYMGINLFLTCKQAIRFISKEIPGLVSYLKTL